MQCLLPFSMDLDIDCHGNGKSFEAFVSALEKIMSFNLIVITKLLSDLFWSEPKCTSTVLPMPYYNLPYSVVALHSDTISILQHLQCVVRISSETGNSSEAGFLQSSQIMSHPPKPDTVCTCVRVCVHHTLPHTHAQQGYIFLHPLHCSDREFVTLYSLTRR